MKTASIVAIASIIISITSLVVAFGKNNTAIIARSECDLNQSICYNNCRARYQLQFNMLQQSIDQEQEQHTQASRACHDKPCDDAENVRHDKKMKEFENREQTIRLARSKCLDNCDAKQKECVKLTNLKDAAALRERQDRLDEENKPSMSPAQNY